MGLRQPLQPLHHLAHEVFDLRPVGTDHLLDACEASRVSGGQAELIGEYTPATVVQRQLQAQRQVEQRCVRGREALAGHGLFDATDDSVVARLLQGDAAIGQRGDDHLVVEQLEIADAVGHSLDDGVSESSRGLPVQANAKVGLRRPHALHGFQHQV